MSEHLQHIFDCMPSEALLTEEERVLAEIIRLQERSQMIAKAILNKTLNPHVEYVLQWSEQEWSDML